jgi:hypothetical protein
MTHTIKVKPDETKDNSILGVPRTKNYENSYDMTIVGDRGLGMSSASLYAAIELDKKFKDTCREIPKPPVEEVCNGVFVGTQGTGKSLAALLFAEHISREYPDVEILTPLIKKESKD